MSERYISYDKLWKLLIDKKMSPADFRRAADISPNTLTKLRNQDKVSMEILLKICNCLDANICDICDFVKTEQAGVSET